jgi:hypothetical protein
VLYHGRRTFDPLRSGEVSARLVSFDGGLGRTEDDVVIPMGTDLVQRLAGDAPATDGSPCR